MPITMHDYNQSYPSQGSIGSAVNPWMPHSPGYGNYFGGVGQVALDEYGNPKKNEAGQLVDSAGNVVGGVPGQQGGNQGQPGGGPSGQGGGGDAGPTSGDQLGGWDQGGDQFGGQGGGAPGKPGDVTYGGQEYPWRPSGGGGGLPSGLLPGEVPGGPGSGGAPFGSQGGTPGGGAGGYGNTGLQPGGGPGGAPGGGLGGQPGGGLPGGRPGGLSGGPQPGAGSPAAGGAPGVPNPALGQFLQGLSGQYNNAYNSALANNKALYAQILQGYHETGQRQVAAQALARQGYEGLQSQTQTYLNPMEQALTQQQQAQGGVQGRYDTLQQNVLGSIQGIDASQRQAIADAYAQQQGATQQSAISRGLGNTTVVDSLQRGNLLDKQKADIALTNQTQALNAGYMSQLGLAGAGYAGLASQQNTGQMNQIANARAGYGTQIGLPYAQYLNQMGQQNTNLDLAQYGFMAGTSIPYPNAQSYANLANSAGQLLGGGAGLPLGYGGYDPGAAIGGYGVGGGAPGTVGGLAPGMYLGGNYSPGGAAPGAYYPGGNVGGYMPPPPPALPPDLTGGAAFGGGQYPS